MERRVSVIVSVLALASQEAVSLTGPQEQEIGVPPEQCGVRELQRRLQRCEHERILVPASTSVSLPSMVQMSNSKVQGGPKDEPLLRGAREVMDGEDAGTPDDLLCHGAYDEITQPVKVPPAGEPLSCFS